MTSFILLFAVIVENLDMKYALIVIQELKSYPTNIFVLFVGEFYKLAQIVVIA